MTDRQLIAFAILALLLLTGAVGLWRRSRRRRRGHSPEPHLRIDLISQDSDEPRKP